MYEDYEFSFVETKLMEWGDPEGTKWALEEVCKSWKSQFPGFKPGSIADFRYVNTETRRRLVKWLWEELRSPRFSPEGRLSLGKMNKLLERIDVEDYHLLRNVARVLEIEDENDKTRYLAEGRKNLQVSEEVALEAIKSAHKAVVMEQRKYVGFLRLIHQLIELGDAGDPDELIPEQALYNAWPVGEIVIAWNLKTCHDKKVGWIPLDSVLEFFQIEVRPLDECDDKKADALKDKLGIDYPPVTEPTLVDNALPLSLIDFYLQRPALFEKHHKILIATELDLIAELLTKV